MKKTFIALLAAVLAAGTATSVSAIYGEDTAFVTLGEYAATANYPASPAAGLPEVTSGQLLTGKIIASANADAERAFNLFDGNAVTSAQMDGSWVGIQLDQAYTLTEVRYIPQPEESAGPSGWFAVQGSNDGEHWDMVIKMYQDAHGTDYHIFSPQTITDQRYIDAGYKARTDESIHWVSDGGSYSMYRITSNHIGDVEFYGNPAPATEQSDELWSLRNIASPNYFPYIVHIREGAEIKNSVDGSLVGTIIGGGGIWNKATWEKAFDNNNKTCYDPCLEASECWVGMMFDEPHALTEVRILPKRGCQVDIQYGRFQASLDGHNWVDLAYLTADDVPNTQSWVSKEVTDTKGYTYFRYVSAEGYQSSAAEILFFGAPAEAAEPFTVDPIIATQHKFTGEFHYSETKTTADNGEITGTPIRGKYYVAWDDNGGALENAFDNNTATKYYPILRLNGPQYWAGLKADTPTAVSKVRVHTVDDIQHYFQGSVDGINWVDLAEFNATVDTADESGWVTKTISDSTVYEYFRVTANGGFAVYEIEIFAAETAVETEAPETAAPETTAPVETDAPVVTPVETTAPAETDEPTAPQTFDFGVVAAVTAIVSAAGYALTKKRK